jgi:radical SAM protein with 4Fe4S-binding SPASM domain
VAVFVREVDQLLMIRPDKTLAINATAVTLLSALYGRGAAGVGATLDRLAPTLNVSRARLLDDTEALVDAVAAILNEDFSPRPALRLGDFDRSQVKYPTLAEIAVTYACQNACSFCYAASPERGEAPDAAGTVMAAEEIKAVMRRIFEEAHVPSLSFTGGEATLRPDLPELLAYAKGLGFRVNLISNGLRLGSEAYARRLVAAGLDSAQLSIEAADPALHDRIVGKPGAFRQLVAAVGNLQRLGVHVHTNTTLCGDNKEHIAELIRFLVRELGQRTMSMNMLIRTGSALGEGRMEITYTEVAQRLPALLEVARQEGMRLVWYSPIPYCLFNPVEHGLGAKSCACVDGILSVSPTGEVLPCSSFDGGIGSLVDTPFEGIYRSRKARYWKDKRFVPPACEGCVNVDICGGACPLYWDAAGSFAELPRPGAGDPKARRRWERERQQGGSFGVAAPAEAQGGDHGAQ